MAAGETEAAVAEYRLAQRQRGDDPAVLLRLAHAYAGEGQVEASMRHYAPLLEEDSTYRFQAAADLTKTARRLLTRGGADQMARALEPVLEMGFGLIPEDLRLELAAHYAERGEFERALPLYLSAVGGPADTAAVSSPESYYRIGRAFEELGGCREAVVYFERYLAAAGSGESEVDGARWHLGSCLYTVAGEDWDARRAERTLRGLRRLIELGVPRTLLDRAHYLRGDVLLERGEREAAISAYEEVLRLNPARSGLLAQRAEERIREIRYRFGEDDF